VPSLEALLDAGADIAAVVTNPDRPAGRGLERQESPVKSAARAAGLEVEQPERGAGPELTERLARARLDAAVVVAYGRLLPASMLEIPRLGFVNLHFSLLPEYRGAAPVQWALIEGARETGVSVMTLDEGMDEGPILATERVPIHPDETAGELGWRLARLGAPLLVRALRDYIEGTLVPRPQEGHPTYAPKISSEQARVDWARSSATIRNLVRGLNPEPGAWSTLRGTRLKVWDVESAVDATGLVVAELRAGDGLVAGTGNGAVELREVQLAGRRRMTGRELARGLRLRRGERME
jgi:methionyl-tRNA formyltransferase